jgi:hypothetical protein
MNLGPLTGDSKNEARIKFVDNHGRETNRPALPKDAVLIMVMNHEHALMDLASMKKVAKSFQADTVSVLTNRDVWPIYNFRTNKDETIIFKQEKNIKQKVLSLINKSLGKFVFAIYPEGDLPYFNANFPLPAHFGAFNIARSAAVENRGKRPVYLVKVFGNFQAAVNAHGDIPFAVEVLSPERVPTDDILGRDPWIETKRAEFERLTLSRRGNHQLDLINRDKFRGSRVRAVAPVAPYQPTGQFMTDFMIMDGRTLNKVTCQKHFAE